MPFKYMSWWSGDLCGPSSSLSIEEMLEEKNKLRKKTTLTMYMRIQFLSVLYYTHTQKIIIADGGKHPC